MPSIPAGAILLHVRQFFARTDEAGPSDQQLLADFAARRDETAFAELVRRHGALVLATCRRVLGDSNAADDVFQATFMVLARKAGSIRKQQFLSGWLYTA